MAETIQCPECGQQYSVGPTMDGKQVQCRKCRTSFSVTLKAAADLGSFLDEELAAASAPPSSSSPPKEKIERSAPEPAPRVPPRPKRKKRRAKPRDRSKLQSTLVMIGTMLIVMPWAQAWMSHKPAMSGPYTTAFTLGTTLLGLALYGVAFVVRSR